MLKTEIILKIIEIKKSHIKWHAYAEALVMEIETESDTLPKAYTDCIFGKWYYGEGQFLYFLESFVELEQLHIKLHDLYIEIYKIQHLPDKLCLLRFTKKDKKVTILNEYVNKLKRISNLIIEKFSDLENEINSMDDDVFSEKYGKF